MLVLLSLLPWPAIISATSPTHSTWQLQVSATEVVATWQRELACQQMVDQGALKVCANAQFLWILQQNEHGVWLTRRDTNAQVSTPTLPSTWLGNALSMQKGDGYQLQMWLSRHHPQQLMQQVQLRWGGRIQLTRKLSGDAFHVQLAAPNADLLITYQPPLTFVTSVTYE